MFTINRFFIAIIQLVLLINSTQQSYVKQAITTVKTVGSTMKKSMTMIHRNKNTIKNIAYGAQKKYLQTKHSFASKSVKHLGVEAIKKFKYTAPQAARGGKQLFSLEAKKNIQMRSGSQINGKDLGFLIKRSAEYMRGKELSSLINMVSKSNPQLPLLAGGGLMRITKFSVLNTDENCDGFCSGDDESVEIPQKQEIKLDAKPKHTLEGGVIFEGELVNGKPHGKGKLTEPSYPDIGDVYEGNFIDGKLQGQGKLFYKSGCKYTGEFVDTKAHGTGQIVYEYGDVYNGKVEDNEANGLGQLRTNRDELLVGYFEEGKMQGKGNYISDDDVVYKGEFEDSKFHGNGKMWYGNEDTYEGEWVNSQREGYGKEVCKNGDTYTGYWKEDNYFGKGEKYEKEGNKTTKGFWEEGTLLSYNDMQITQK